MRIYKHLLRLGQSDWQTNTTVRLAVARLKLASPKAERLKAEAKDNGSKGS